MSTSNTKKEEPGISITQKKYDHTKDPYVIKKVERARAFIAKHGLPKDDKSVKKGE